VYKNYITCYTTARGGRGSFETNHPIGPLSAQGRDAAQCRFWREPAWMREAFEITHLGEKRAERCIIIPHIKLHIKRASKSTLLPFPNKNESKIMY